jgi:DNA-binding response OmpR family regulator
MSRARILLVDDANTILMIEKMILSRGPYELVTAHDGLEAVELVRRERPNLILLDLMMPRMDGLEVLRELRKDLDGSPIPIIMVTTRGEEKHVSEAFSHGCTDYIVKPINGIELLAKVRNYLGE